VPGSPGLQAISFNTSCEIEIALTVMQAAGQLRQRLIGSEFRSSGPVFALFCAGNVQGAATAR
jgi:hypothetical protein